MESSGGGVMFGCHFVARKEKSIIWALLISLSFLVSASLGIAQSLENDGVYRLSAGDKISLRVVIWDEGERDYVIWRAVSGEFSVQSEGRVMVPLAGHLPAAGRTPEELAYDVADALKAQVRSNDPPSTSVEVVEYGAFYILGDVDNPGAYSAQPGLTVLQAFALAGGGRHLDTVNGDPLSVLRETGSLEQIQAELLRAQITSHRLRAEIEEHTELRFPETLGRDSSADKLARLLDEETRIFSSRRTALEREQASLMELIALLTTEIENVEKKIQSQQEQLRLAQEYLENTQSLVDKGLAKAPQLTQAQKGVFDVEAKTLDLQNTFFRASQSIKEAERDIVALRANRATQAAVELQNVSARIESLLSRRETVRLLLLERGATNTVVDEDLQTETIFSLQRGRGDAAKMIPGADTIVLPGDVINVEQRLVPADEVIPG
ncbi:polysaccharide biosynthesis/export family protein [Shimia sp.]|uniref:polysaccharide biosynthesis/export family protein n=1 Tax=Shimia sp. TaxID=1954381 RepID=UPI003BA96057